MRLAGESSGRRAAKGKRSPRLTRRAGKSVVVLTSEGSSGVESPPAKLAKTGKGGSARRYPFPFVLPSGDLVTTWGVCYRLRWAKRRAKNNYMKRFSRRGIPLP